MKKSLVVLLTLVFILGIAGTAFAANAFSDVPAGHWAYSAVNKLAAAGVIDGMGDGTFKGDKTLTRYEMATFVARAMTKEDKVTAEQRALIEKLANEFANELQGLGVRVQRLEDNANKIVIEGNARLRYDDQPGKPAGTTTFASAKNIDLDIFATYNIGDSWAVKTESEWLRKIDNPYYASDSETDMMDGQCKQLYITSGKHFMVGRHTYAPGYGLALNSEIQGIQYATGNDNVTAIVNWAHTSDTARIGDDENNAADLKTAEVIWALSPKTNIRADFERVENVSSAIHGYTKYCGLGGDTKIGDFTVTAAASKVDLNTDANYDAKAYLAKIQYKVADKNVAHSSDVFVAYSKVPRYNTLDQDDETYDSGWSSSVYRDNYLANFKGTQVGFNYVPMKNTMITVWYMTGKTIDAESAYSLNAGDDVKMVRAQAQFFF